MSETVHYKGKLKNAMLDNESVEQASERIFKKVYKLNGYIKDEDYSWFDELCGYFYEEFIVLNGKLYAVINKQEVDPDFSFYKISENKDEGFDFEVKYYNGCEDLHQAIQKASEITYSKEKE